MTCFGRSASVCDAFNMLESWMHLAPLSKPAFVLGCQTSHDFLLCGEGYAQFADLKASFKDLHCLSMHHLLDELKRVSLQHSVAPPMWPSMV